MLHTFLKTVAGIIVAPLVSVLGFAGYSLQPNQPVVVQQTLAPIVGASNIIDTPIALFATSLASPITSTATTMTLVSATTGDGSTLASSTYSFIIDEGQSDQEFVRADCTGTTCINMARGLSMIDGQTSISSLAQQHRRGQSVKITDAPLLLVTTNLINGVNGFPNKLSYTSAVATSSFTSAQQIIDKGYADYLAFNGAGVVNASTAARGVSQLATAGQQAASTATSGGNPLVLQSANATSTFNSATAANQVVVTQNTGKIDSNFLPSTFTSATTFSATTTLATTTIQGFDALSIGKNLKIFTSSGSWVPPLGLATATVEVIGAGGTGYGAGSTQGGGGGGAGGFAFKEFALNGTTSVQILISSSQSSFGGISGGVTIQANAGANASTFSGGAGGTAVGGDINIQGGGGCGGVTTASANTGGGCGGSNPLGFGGNGTITNGGAGTGFGGGGAGSGPSSSPGGGAGGGVIISW